MLDADKKFKRSVIDCYGSYKLTADIEARKVKAFSDHDDYTQNELMGEWLSAYTAPEAFEALDENGGIKGKPFEWSAEVWSLFGNALERGYRDAITDLTLDGLLAA